MVETLEEKLLRPPVTTFHDFSQSIHVHTDAYDYGLRAVLAQNLGEQERLKCCASCLLSRAERNYDTTETECLAIVWRFHSFQHFDIGQPFEVLTNHSRLRWVNHKKW